MFSFHPYPYNLGWKYQENILNKNCKNIKQNKQKLSSTEVSEDH